MWTDNETYFNRKEIGKLFGLPILHLNFVCWLSPWGLIENVKVPNQGENVFNLFFYHKYGRNFTMPNCDLNVIIEEQSETEFDY